PSFIPSFHLLSLLILFSLSISAVVGMDKICRVDEPCSVSYKTLGCFADSMGDRVLPNYIYNERDSTVSNYGNRDIEWYNWEKYMAGFSCRCAKRAKQLGYDLFGMQFYGECWAGKSGTHDYARLGSSKKCRGDYYKPCGSLDRYCSGEHETNFVFQIVDISCSLEIERVGCYRDNHNSNARPLANYVLNDRDPTHASYSGQSIDWVNYDVYLPQLACRCAKKAKENGGKYFGLQFYGECWTHPQGDETYGRDGKSDVSCINQCYRNCNDQPFCVGELNMNYVYRIKEAGQVACDIAIESMGCYKEKTADRALRTELVNTNPASDLFYGQMPVGGKWDSFIPGFLCSCAQKAKISSWEYFGVTDFGACYSDVASESYSKHGASSSCGEGHANNTCAAGSMKCSGADAQTNYVYKITLPSSSSKRSFVPAKDPIMRGFKDFEF
ncbi:hypothetical protein QZH41_016254, partial [Actinostola sp. cb2023]